MFVGGGAGGAVGYDHCQFREGIDAALYIT